MGNMILLDRTSQATIFKQKDCADNIFIAKGDDFSHSSDVGYSRRNLPHKISDIKGDLVLNEKLMSSILYLKGDAQRRLRARSQWERKHQHFQE